jgi:hypothetical protein
MRYVRRLSAVATIAGLAACGAQTATSVAGRSPIASAASCVGLTPAQQLRYARKVLVGVMLHGPVLNAGNRLVLATPARMRVLRYLKGHGPRTVTVETAVSPTANGTAVSEDGIEPRAGQR